MIALFSSSPGDGSKKTRECEYCENEQERLDRIDTEHECRRKHYDHLNNFVQDLCSHIDEECDYIVLPGSKGKCDRKGNRLYVSNWDQLVNTEYYYILTCVGHDLSLKYKDKDINGIAEKLEQIAYNLRYLSSPIHVDS